MFRLPLAAFIALALATQGRAETVLYDSHGFEEPTFTAGGTIVGQDASNPWLRDGGSPAGFEVAGGVGVEGSQGVQGNGGGLNDFTFVWPDLHRTPAPNEKIRVQVDMARTLSTGGVDSSPVFAVDVYDFQFRRTSRFGLQSDNGTIRAFVSVPINAQGQIDPAGPMNRSEFLGAPIAENTFVHFDFLLNYVAKTVSLTMNGTLLAGGLPFRTRASTTLDSAELQVGTFNNVSNDHGYFDNYVVTSVPVIPGDFDHDGVVDGDDLVKWQGDFGIGAGSDADDDGDSDGSDFLIWQQQLGVSLPVAQGVPEPGAVSLALIGLPLARRLRRRGQCAA